MVYDYWDEKQLKNSISKSFIFISFCISISLLFTIFWCFYFFKEAIKHKEDRMIIKNRSNLSVLLYTLKNNKLLYISTIQPNTIKSFEFDNRIFCIKHINKIIMIYDKGSKQKMIRNQYVYIIIPNEKEW